MNDMGVIMKLVIMVPLFTKNKAAIWFKSLMEIAELLVETIHVRHYR